MRWWVAADAICNAASLINADVINVHFGWEHHVPKVLCLEGSFGERHQITIPIVAEHNSRAIPKLRMRYCIRDEH